MMRTFFAYVLALVLTVTSFSLAHARGNNPDVGSAIEMVICTGVGMKVLTVGPDGEPIETVHLCPDGAQIFAAEFSLPVVQMPEERLVIQLAAAHATAHIGRTELTPSARGPPELV
ncbi:hypothetical protein K3556_12815 [Aliiroseovarius sp. M344]|uniref:hypothetical protein n=1 Tax=Aliiroseovarius sp. M344 TaxID=2867010 RepID=UPI0021ADF6AE|nr:hypothetical protein [Aliiroseovarius sp. M344]UWQ13800.1 hypothetical protein K3556_12815 [Aliiroseovarius sp. M344]